MKVVWSDAARGDLRAAVTYIKHDNPEAARRVARRIRSAAASLEDLPERFRPGFAPDTREHLIPGLPYILVYRIESDRVKIIAMFHAAQNKPRGG
jgi:toxin ParE1/3/4